MSSSSPKSQPFRFLDLPPELRNVVYGLATGDSDLITISSTGTPAHALLYVNQQIRAEAFATVCKASSILWSGDTHPHLDRIQRFLEQYDRFCPGSREKLRFIATLRYSFDSREFVASICRWRTKCRQEGVRVQFKVTTGSPTRDYGLGSTFSGVDVMRGCRCGECGTSDEAERFPLVPTGWSRLLRTKQG